MCNVPGKKHNFRTFFWLNLKPSLGYVIFQSFFHYNRLKKTTTNIKAFKLTISENNNSFHFSTYAP